MDSTLNGRFSGVMRFAVGASLSRPVLLHRRLGRRPSWTGKPRWPVLLLGRGALRGTHLRTLPRRQPPTPSQRWNVPTRLSGRHQTDDGAEVLFDYRGYGRAYPIGR